MAENVHQGRILVVDDEEVVARLLQQWLRGEGYHVKCAYCFEEVRARMLEEEFDLLTLDIVMPKVDGLSILRWVRAHYPDTGVVMATALDDLATVLEAMRAGAINYLLKPFNLELVSEEIGRAMERQRLLLENRAYQRELEKKVEERTWALQEAYAQLERQVRELEGRDRLVHFQMEPHTLAEAHAEILEVLGQVLGVRRAILYQADGESGRLKAVAVMGFSAPGRIEGMRESKGLPELSMAEKDRMEVRAFRERKPQWLDGRAAVPILYRDEARGVLSVEDLNEEREPDLLNALWRLAGEAALVLQGASMAEGLEKEIPSLDELGDLA